MPAKPKRYIWITRWEEFQHYAPERDRAPAWIKSYTKQMADERYLQLTDRQRALLRDLRDVFSIAHGRLSDDVRMIARRRSCHTREADLKALVQAGLIEIVSRPTLDRRLEKLYASRARPRSRGEVELEVENPLPPSGTSNGKGMSARARALLESATRYVKLEAHVADDAKLKQRLKDEFGIVEPSVVEELLGVAATSRESEFEGEEPGA